MNNFELLFGSSFLFTDNTILLDEILHLVISDKFKESPVITKAYIKNINQLTYKSSIIIALFTIKNGILTMNTNY